MRPVLLTSFLSLVSTLVLLHHGIVSSQNIGIPAELIAKALNHAVAHPDTTEDDDDDEGSLVLRLQNGDVDALYRVAESMNAIGNAVDSVVIWHHLADSSAHHIPSTIALGFAYEENEKAQAVRYFVRAGEEDRASLYNAGRLFVELEEFDRALGYFLACIDRAPDSHLVGRALTDVATEAYETLSKQLIDRVRSGGLTLQEIIDMFLYGSMDNFPNEGSAEESLWTAGVEGLKEFGRTKDGEALESARKYWTNLQSYGGLSDLQHSLLDAIMTKTSDLVKYASTEL